MKKVGVIVFFDHHDNDIHGDLNIPEESGFYRVTLFFFDESTTYEEMVRMLIQSGRLLPLDDLRLRYNLVLQAFEASWQGIPPLLPGSLSKPVTLGEGQTLASTHLTRLVMDESEFNRYHLNRRINALFCATSVEIRDSPPPKSPSSTTSPKRGDVISSVRDLFVTTATATATAMSIIGGLDVIERRWREWRTTHHPPRYKAPHRPQKRTSWPFASG